MEVGSKANPPWASDAAEDLEIGHRASSIFSFPISRCPISRSNVALSPTQAGARSQASVGTPTPTQLQDPASVSRIFRVFAWFLAHRQA